MRITADTNFFISATQWDNSVANKLLVKLLEKDVKIFTTKEILDEFVKVLQRDFNYNKEEISKILEKVLVFVFLVEPTEKINVIKDDMDDNKVLECAVESKSDSIVTYDKHLLNLKEFRKIKISKPEEIISIV